MDIEYDEQGLPYVDSEIESIVGHECIGRGRRRRVSALVVRFEGFGEEFDRVYGTTGSDSLADLIESAPHVVHAYCRDQLLTLPAPLQERVDELVSS